jgi:hypothetical protein
MAYVADDIYNISQARMAQEKKSKVAVALWEDQNVEDKVFCPICLVKLKYIDAGKNLWCKECGNKTPVQEVKHEKKLTSRFARTGNQQPIIMSKGPLKRKKSIVDNDSVNADLTDEDLLDLRRMGYRI